MFCSECGAQVRAQARFCGQCGARQGGLTVGAMLDGRYRVEERIGSGAMGAVYRAWDLRLQSPRALKEMSTRDESAAEREETRARFIREAQLLSRVQHPGLPRVQDFFSAAGRHYLVMDLIEGDNLEDALRRHGRPGLPEAHVVTLAAQILDILAFLHAQSPAIIYRDLKPSNAMITPAGHVVLIDFGIARPLVPAGSGSAVGTHGYCPPEQYTGRCDGRSDIYALGATMHHLLSGHPSPIPFHFLPLQKVVPDVSPQLAHVIERALEMQPEDRFESAVAMKRALLGVEPDPNRIAPGVARAGLAHAQDGGVSARLNPIDGSLLVRLPGGTVTVCTEAQAARTYRDVTLGAFWIAPRPVSNAQFRRFVAMTGHRPAADWTAQTRRGGWGAGTWERYAAMWGEDAPVVGVSRRDAEAYCRWAHLRLPFETEWDLTAGFVQQAALPRSTTGGQLTVNARWHVPEWCAPSPSALPGASSGGHGSAVRGGVWAGADGFPEHVHETTTRDADQMPCIGFRCAANA